MKYWQRILGAGVVIFGINYLFTDSNEINNNNNNNNYNYNNDDSLIKKIKANTKYNGSVLSEYRKKRNFIETY